MRTSFRRQIDRLLDRESSNGVPSNTEPIDKHLERFFNDDETYVIHERTSETVHTDIFVVRPNEPEGRDYYILLTSGMSALPMNIHENHHDYRYGELMMLLPIDWNMKYEEFDNENNWWPMRLLIGMTKYPHQENTWLGYGHTYALGDQESYAPNTKFNAAILLDSITVPRSFLKVKRRFNRDIYIHVVIPIYPEELEYKLEYGSEALIEKFDENEIEEIVNIKRVNTCK